MIQQDKGIEFSSKTVLGRDEESKVLQLLASLVNAHQSLLFREPVDWKAYNLMDYPTIITRPMDLSTVKKKIATRSYENVEDCLDDINLIWENAKLYNPKQHEIHKLADKLQKQTKKMIRNYLPFVKIDTSAGKKKAPKKQTKPIKGPVKIQEPKTYLQKQEQAKEQENENQEPEEAPHIVERKNLLYLMQICSKQQIGVIFLLIKGNCPQCLEYDQFGGIDVRGEKISDVLLKRLNNLMEMWGISFKNVTITTNKKK